MRRFILSIGSAALLLASPLVAQAQPTKTVSGTISELSAGAITIKAADGKEMKFVIDGKTQVTTPGGGTKSRAAEAAGKGVGAMDVLKVGEAVEIRYHEEGMHAANIRTIASVPGPSTPGAKSQTASGVVASMSGSSLVVKGASAEWTFTVDEKTTVIATGAGTAGEKAKSEGKRPSLSELVHEGDTVSVTYHEVDGAKRASVVRITKRKT